MNSDFYINVIGKQDSYNFWKTFQQVCFQVGQGIVYFILKKLLNYPCMTVLLGYKKKAIAIFAKIKHLIEYLQVAIIEHKKIWNSIILVVAFNSLYNDFEMIIKRLCKNIQ